MAAAACVGCSTSSSGGFILFPLPYKLLDSTKNLKYAHQNPIQWPRELNKNVTGPAVAEPGDILSISATDPANRIPFVGEQPILLDGTIDLAKFGRVVVGYRPLAEIEAIINAAVKANGAKDVVVTVRFARAPESKRVYVLGDVVTPGSYPINGNETVLDAILLAGGLTRKADERNIILSRPTPVCDCRVVVPICHEHIVQWGDTSTNYQLLPGDRIYVPTLSLFHRIFGKLGPQYPPCCGCPTACPLPAELCNEGCARPGAIVDHEHPVSVSLPPPVVPAVAPPKTMTPPPSAPRIEERSPPVKPTLRETPKGATALPRGMFPAGPEFEPVLRSTSDRITRSPDPMAAPPAPAPVRTMSGERPKIGTAETIREPAPTDWQSPWRPAGAKNDL